MPTEAAPLVTTEKTETAPPVAVFRVREAIHTIAGKRGERHTLREDRSSAAANNSRDGTDDAGH